MIELLQKYHEMFTAAWQYFKTHAPNVSDDMKFWTEALMDATELDKQHNSQFLRDLLTACYSELERISKEGKGGGA